MALLKEYVVKIRWQHDTVSKRAVLKGLQEDFKNLTKDIEKATGALKNFNKLGIEKMKSAAASTPSALPPILKPPKLNILKTSSKMHSIIGGPMDIVKEPESMTSKLSGVGEELLPLLGPVAAISVGLLGIQQAIYKIGGKIDKYGQQILQSSAQIQGVQGFNQAGFAVSTLRSNTGIDLSPLGRFTTLTRQARQNNPAAIRQLFTLANRLRQADVGDPNAQNIADMIATRRGTGQNIWNAIANARGETGEKMFNLLTGLGVGATSANLASRDVPTFQRFLQTQGVGIGAMQRKQLLDLQYKVAILEDKLLEKVIPLLGPTLTGVQKAAHTVMETMRLAEKVLHMFHIPGLGGAKKVGHEIGGFFHHLYQDASNDAHRILHNIDPKGIGSGDTDHLVSKGSNSFNNTYGGFLNTAFGGGT